MTALFRRSHLWLLAAATLMLLSGCRSAPDMQPFADATTNLAGGIKSVGRQMGTEIRRMSARWPDAAQAQAATKTADRYEDTWAGRGRLAEALVEYSQSLVAIAKAGDQGEQSAKALADSFQKLCSAADIALPAAGSAAGEVVRVGAMLYGKFARHYAATTLGNGMRQMQPYVDEAAELLDQSVRTAQESLSDIRAQVVSDLARIDVDGQPLSKLRATRGELAARRQAVISAIQARNNIINEHAAAEHVDDAAKKAKLDAAYKLAVESIASFAEELRATEPSLARMDAMIAAVDASNAAELERIDAQIRLLGTVREGLAAWAAAHGRLADAALERRAPSVEDLVAAATEIRDAVRLIRRGPAKE